MEATMNAFRTHFSFEFRTGIRNKNLLLLFYLFPLGFYLMMAVIMVGINPPFLEVLIPAMVIFAILAATMLGLPEGLVNGRETGIFRSYKINGVPVVSIISIPALTTALHLTIVAAIITFSAPLLFDAPAPENWFYYVLVFFVMVMTCSCLGILIGVISANSRAAILWSQLIFIPSMLLGGLMIPYSLLPDAAQKVSLIMPTTHAMNAFNGLAFGRTADFNPWASVAILLSSGILAFALAIFLFSWDSKNTTRRAHPALAALVLLPYILGILFL
jgi:ABC-2 type transport system permease protein